MSKGAEEGYSKVHCGPWFPNGFLVCVDVAYLIIPSHEFVHIPHSCACRCRQLGGLPEGLEEAWRLCVCSWGMEAGPAGLPLASAVQHPGVPWEPGLRHPLVWGREAEIAFTKGFAISAY